MSTPEAERQAALAAYKAACAEFDQAQQLWDPYLASTGDSDADAQAAEAAFDRLSQANRARQDAIDALWLAWRNRPT